MQPNDVIDGRYRLERMLGAGGLGVVWAATRIDDGELLAIKFLKRLTGATDAERFSLEAEALRRLEHPGCVEIELFQRTEAGQPYLVMELLEGQPLSALRGAPQPIARVLEILRQLFDVLAYTHRRGVVHRDLKPENIFLVGDAAQTQVKVLDFGLAKLAGGDLPDITKTGEVFGTPSYMSPEQLRGTRHAGPATDLYAVGVIAFELIEGRPLFTGPTALAIAMAHLKHAAPAIRRVDCPAELRDLVARLLSKSPDERGSAADALLVVADRKPGSTLLVAVVAGCIAVVGLLAVMLLEPDPEPSAPIALQNSRPIGQQPSVEHEPPATAQDVSTDGTADAPSCKPPAPGLHKMKALEGFVEVNWWVHVPEKRDRDLPLVVLFHHDRSTGEVMLRETKFDALAEEKGFVVVGMQSAKEIAWRESFATAEQLRITIDETAAALCVAAPDVFVVGHGAGGAPATDASCLPEVRGIATVSFSAELKAKFRCETPCPALLLLPDASGHVPREGGLRCHNRLSGRARSFEAFEKLWADRNACGPGDHPTDHGCRARDCPASLEICITPGGHGWPGTERKSGADPFNCDTLPGDFPAAEVIWDFFEALPSRR